MEPVQVMQRVIEAYNRGDAEELTELVTPDFVWYPAVASLVEAQTYDGPAGIRRYFEDMAGVFETLEVTGGDYRPLTPELVVFIGRLRGRGLGSGIELDEQFSIIGELRDGKMHTIRAYLDHAPALDAIERVQRGEG